MKVGVDLGFTVCTNQELRNYTRFSCSISDIDTDGDVEAQAKNASGAIMKVFMIADETIGEQIVEVLPGLGDSGATIKGDVVKLQEQQKYFKEKLVPNIVGKVKELIKKVDHDAEAK